MARISSRGDGQAQAGAVVPARGRGVDLRERGEDALLILRRDADARVGHGEPHPGLAIARRFELHVERHAAAFGELHGVGEQIDQHLPQPQRVANEVVGHGLVDVGVELESLFSGAVAERVAQLVDDLPQIEAARSRAPACRLPASRGRESRSAAPAADARSFARRRGTRAPAARASSAGPGRSCR